MKSVPAPALRFAQRLTLILVACVTAASLALHYIWPPAWPSQAFTAVVIDLWLIPAVAVPWVVYRRYKVIPWGWTAIFVSYSIAGGAVGASVAALQSWNTWGEYTFGWLPKTLFLGVLAGVSFAMIGTAISRVRLGEAARRSAQLAEENERERRARQAVQAELKMLQAQVEPHFLFNTLANVRHLMQSGSPQAVPMLDHLIHYLRTALPDIRSDSTTLGREVELARAYLEIMRMRMGGELVVTVDLPAELAGQAFPPLMLMTLVENAVKHGIVPKGRGELRIGARREGDRIDVEVRDDGRGLGGALGQGLGLTNVRERLRALYGDSARLVLESTDSGGTVARLEIPA
ncbi:MAG TPA: histidine kinase [Usitatibacter sp.]